MYKVGTFKEVDGQFVITEEGSEDEVCYSIAEICTVSCNVIQNIT